MPLPQETRKKILIGMGVILIIVVAIIAVYTFVFNRGTLTVKAEPPYRVQIGQFIVENCTEDPCEITLKPGDYPLYISKDGYRDVITDITIPIAGQHTEDVEFDFIPYIVERGNEYELKYFSDGEELSEKLSEQLPDKYFPEEKFVAYLDRNPENGRQTLYYSEIIDAQLGELGEKKVATSFIRTINDYLIIPLIEDQGKIVFIEIGEEESIMYMIDLSAKRKSSLLSYPLIGGVKWIPGTESFIFEARDNGGTEMSIFLHESGKYTSTKLNLQTTIDNIAVVSKDKLIAATTQPVSGVQEGGELEGRLVTLGESNATPVAGEVTISVSDTELFTGLQVAPSLNFVEYEIGSNQARLIKAEDSLSLSEKVKLSTDRKGILFLSGGVVYELRFEE